MARVLPLFVITSAAIGLVVYMAWHPELWEPWLADQGITRSDPEFRKGLKLVLAIVLGVPLTALIYAIGQLGSDRSQTDIHGQTVLRLRAGTRWFTTISCLGLAALFFAYPMVDPAAPAPWAFQAAGGFCLLAIPVILKAKVRYDNSTITVSNSFGGSSSFHWSELTDIREVPQMKHYHFVFKNGKKASISYSYAGLGDLLQTAREKLVHTHGTGRT